jgi:hypothetical protein
MKFEYPDYIRIDYLKEKKELISIVLLGVSALLAILILVKITSFFVVSARAKSLAESAIEQNNVGTQDTGKFVAESIEIANKLKRENLFAPSAPKQHPIKEVRAIFGDEVLINNRWYKVGQTVGDAKIVAIEPTQVRVEWDGAEKTFLPINASSPDEGESRRASGEGGPGPERPDIVVVGSESGPPAGRSGAMGGRMRQRMENMSDEDRERFRNEMQAMRERFRDASPEERERMRAEMREREMMFGGGRRGRGPGGGRGE